MDIFKKRLIKCLKYFEKKSSFLIPVYFILVALYITYPLILNMSRFITQGIDQLYITWIINWDIYSLSNNIGGIFNTNIFYPYHNTLAYSETFITSAILAFLPTKLIGEPAVAFNFTFIFSLITVGYFTYILVNYITKDVSSALISGTLVSFSTYSLGKYMHLQLLSIEWLPLSILFFIMFLDKKLYKYLLFSLIFFVVQTYNSFLPGYFIVFSYLFIFLWYFFKNKIKFKKRDYYKIILMCAISVLVLLPVIIPYYQVSKEFNYTRDIRDSIHFANRPEYTFFPNEQTKLHDLLINVFYKNDKGPYIYDGYMGLMFILLTFFMIIARFFSRIKNFFWDIFLLTGVFGYILSLGPALQWGGKVIKLPFIIPLPYALFYYLIPGFNGLRNSARWEMLFLFSFSVAIGIFLSELFKRKSHSLKLLFTAVICFIVIWEFNFPYKYVKVPVKSEFPKVYNYIRNLPKDTVIAEFPIFNWNTFFDLNYIEITREYYSTNGFYKTINGGAGFDPPSWQKEVDFLVNNFPNDKSINLIKKKGVNHIVLHAGEYDLMNKKGYKINDNLIFSGNKVRQMLESSKSVKLIYSEGTDFVYEIH